MKNKYFTIVIVAIITLFINACNTPEQKVANAEKNVNEANKKLKEVKQQYEQDIEVYRTETGNRIAANTKSIADFNARIAADKKDAKELYEKQIMIIDNKNTDLKKRMADYKADGNEKWQVFKAEFTSEMNELATSLRNLSLKNK